MCDPRMRSLLLAVLAACASGCTKEESVDYPKDVAKGVRLVGWLEHPRLTESSGLVASRQHPGVFWTHNDGGKRKELLFAVARTGATIATFRVRGPQLFDWEDLASDGQGHLFVGDLGNDECKRTELAVHQFDEPDPSKGNGTIDLTRSWRLLFPGKPFNCESLFVWGDFGYVISKLPEGDPAGLYRFPLEVQTKPFVLERVTTLKIDSPVTGAALSTDGKVLGLVGHHGAFVYRCDGDFAHLGELKPAHTRFHDRHIEGCTFVADGLLATAESREVYLFTDPAFVVAQ